MNIEDYLKLYQLPIGTKVTIKECHTMPQIVGKTAAVRGWVDPEVFGYPLMVILDEKVYIPMPGTPMAVGYQGPHYCRPDELTVGGAEASSEPEIKGNVPDVFKDAFKDKPKDNGKN